MSWFYVFSFFNITLVMRKLKGSHIKWWHVLRTYLNILKNCYQTKTNRGMFQHDFQFFANLMTFFSKRKKWSNIPFSYLFFTFVQIFKPKKKRSRDMCIWVFSITLSHFERITWIFTYDGCHNYFWKIII